MPSLRSGSPKVNPASDFSTTNAEMLGAAPAVGVGHREHRVVLARCPALVIQDFCPLSTQSSPSGAARGTASTPCRCRPPARTARRRTSPRRGPPAAGSGALTSSTAARISGIVPSLLTAGISEDDAQPRATSSITMQVASASAPTPSYCSGMCGAWKSAATQRVVRRLGELALVVHLGRVRRDLVLGDRRGPPRGAPRGPRTAGTGRRQGSRCSPAGYYPPVALTAAPG